MRLMIWIAMTLFISMTITPTHSSPVLNKATSHPKLTGFQYIQSIFNSFMGDYGPKELNIVPEGWSCEDKRKQIDGQWDHHVWTECHASKHWSLTLGDIRQLRTWLHQLPLVPHPNSNLLLSSTLHTAYFTDFFQIALFKWNTELGKFRVLEIQPRAGQNWFKTPYIRLVMNEVDPFYGFYTFF